MAGFDFPLPNVRSARELLAAFYGLPVITQPQESDYTIGTTAVPIGKYPNTRLAWNLSNTGAGNIAFGFSAAVTITTGFLLEPGGFSRSTWYYDFELVTYPLWAIGAGSGETLYMLENVLTGA